VRAFRLLAAIPRLGIAAYGWWNEAGHGVAREGTPRGTFVVLVRDPAPRSPVVSPSTGRP
jgi:hypothetical protein